MTPSLIVILAGYAFLVVKCGLLGLAMIVVHLAIMLFAGSALKGRK